MFIKSGLLLLLDLLFIDIFDDEQVILIVTIEGTDHIVDLIFIDNLSILYLGLVLPLKVCELVLDASLELWKLVL